ncbi:MAG: class I SAM-dependent DNA methyltransferase [Myxococcota bacterium]
MSSPSLQVVAQLLRDRLDPADVRSLACWLVTLRLLSLREDAPSVLRQSAWIEDGRSGLQRATRTALDHWPRLATAQPVFPTLEPERLTAVLRAVLTPEPTDHADPLGQTFMALLSILAKAEGRRGGQFYTPPCVSALLARLVVRPGDQVYDPCCGAGSLLLAARERGAAALIGQEINPITRNIAVWSSVLADHPLDVGQRAADSLNQDQHPELRADSVVANPPFNLARWGQAAPGDPRFPYGTPPASNANFAWLQHVLTHLKPQGRAAVVLCNGSTTSRRAAERKIRARLVQDGRVHSIIALPDQLFENTVIPATIWVLGPPRPTVQFIDVRDLGQRIDRTHKRLTNAVIDRVIGWTEAATDPVPPAVPGRVCSVATAQVQRELAPGLYVGVQPSEPPRPDALDQARQRARDLAEQARILDAQIIAALDELP